MTVDVSRGAGGLAPTRARLSVDLGALASNWRLLAARFPKAACGGVVKANAYGLGIETVVPALLSAGCGTFFVAHLEEGRRVRALAPSAHVYVLNGLPAGHAQSFAEFDIRPVLGSNEEIFEWASFQRNSGWRGGAALHVDTGMNRLGLRLPEARDLSQAPDRPPLSLVMSHLACADDPEHPLNKQQIEAFSEVRRWFPTTPASLANSSGIFLPDNIAFDFVRPGAAMYGVNPTPRERNPMQPVVTLSAPIIQIRDVPMGETVGYGADWTARRASRVAVVALGYADGLFRAASPAGGRHGAEAIVAGRRRPVIGRISMDLAAIDVTGLPEFETQRGAMVQFLGPDIGVDEAARWAGTIGYEILTSLGSRFDRVTVD